MVEALSQRAGAPALRPTGPSAAVPLDGESSSDPSDVVVIVVAAPIAAAASEPVPDPSDVAVVVAPVAAAASEPVPDPTHDRTVPTILVVDAAAASPPPALPSATPTVIQVAPSEETSSPPPPAQPDARFVIHVQGLPTPDQATSLTSTPLRMDTRASVDGDDEASVEPGTPIRGSLDVSRPRSQGLGSTQSSMEDDSVRAELADERRLPSIVDVIPE